MNETGHLRSFTKTINTLLESRWSKKQLDNGKWIELSNDWPRDMIKELIVRYQGAGWVVTRNVELTSYAGVKKYLVFTHPQYYVPGFLSTPS